jgi:predicted Zn-dependent protease
MRRLNDAEAAAIKSRRIQVVTVKPGDTITNLSARMAYGSLKQERFLALNGLKADARLQAGQKVKLVILG